MPASKLIVGGTHITLSAKDFFEKDNDGVFDFINKGEKLSAIENAVKTLKKHKIKVDAFFIISLPFETIKSIKKSINLIRKLSIDNVNMFLKGRKTNFYFI